MRTFPLIVTLCLIALVACKEPPPPMATELPPEPPTVVEPPSPPTPTNVAPQATATTAAIAIQPMIADGAKLQFSL